MIDEKLVELGSHYDRKALAEQGKASVALARQESKVLAENGWVEEKETNELAAAVQWLETSEAIQNDMREQSRGALRNEVTAVAGTKEVVHRLRQVLPIVVRKSAVPVKLEAFESGGPLGKQPKRLSNYLAKVFEDVKRLDADLKPYFKGQLASEIVAKLKARLDTAAAQQELSHGNLPEQTKQVYAAKGKVVQLIGDLNRVGRAAFYGQAEKASRFNKDILLRARHAEAKHETEQDETKKDDVAKPA